MTETRTNNDLPLIPPIIEYMRDGIGYVELDWATDADKDIARIARISTGSQNKGERADRKLLATLIRELHTSPLEMGHIRFKMQMPLFIVAQLIRHRMASYSQKSGRYVPFEVKYYSPGINGWRMQGRGNKQVSGGSLDYKQAFKAETAYQEAMETAVRTYLELLDYGVAREQARIVLPQSIYTELFAQFNFNSLMNLLKLRLAPDAQPEFQEYAQAIFSILKGECPILHRLVTIVHEVDRRLKVQRDEIWTDLMAEWDAEGGV